MGKSIISSVRRYRLFCFCAGKFGFSAIFLSSVKVSNYEILGYVVIKYVSSANVNDEQARINSVIVPKKDTYIKANRFQAASALGLCSIMLLGQFFTILSIYQYPSLIALIAPELF